MRIKILTIILLIITGDLFAQLSGNDISLETERGRIEGTLLFSPTSQKTPIVLIIAGSGPTDRNGNNPMMTNNSLKLLAEGLLEKGIASIRYDKRGVGESKRAGLQEKDLRFETYISDTEAWIDLLKKDERFSDIIIIGHSEGSLIGMIAAQKEGVEKFISIAGVGTTAGKLLREQLHGQPPVVLDQTLPIIEKLENGEIVDEVPQMLYSLFRPSVQPYMISWFKYNPQEEIAKLNKPVLIIQGTTDIQVSVSDADKLVEANRNAKKRIIEGMNHILKDSEMDRQKNIQTYTVPDLPLNENLIEVVFDFINE